MSTNPQKKRITKQIRVGERLHRRIKLEAIRQGKTMSKFIDAIVEEHFTHKDQSKNTISRTNKGR